jgi:hypothetical protein
MSTRLGRVGLWTLAGAFVVLCARWSAYAVSPDPAARLLERRGGGPALPTIGLAALALGAGLAIAVCWLAALGVRERALLERRLLSAPAPRFRTGRTVLDALALTLVTSVAGGLLEAYVHWRAGLGWHGLHCLVGPVHRDLFPFEGAFSLVATAIIAAARHVVAWMRRTFALLRRLPSAARVDVSSVCAPAFDLPRAILCPAPGAPRAPPAFS